MKRRERVIRTTCLSWLSFCKTLLVLKIFVAYFYRQGESEKWWRRRRSSYGRRFFKTERTCFSWNGKDVSLVTDLYMWQNYGENTVRKITWLLGGIRVFQQIFHWIETDWAPPMYKGWNWVLWGIEKIYSIVLSLKGFILAMRARAHRIVIKGESEI